MNIKKFKHIWVLYLLLFCSEALCEDRIRFSFQCKILDQVILESNDGQSTRYNGRKGREKIGDFYNIGFDLEKLSDGYLLSIDTKDDSLYFGSANESMVSEGFINKRKNDEWLNLSADYFNMGSIKGAISGVRYRKNDWSLMYTGLEALSGRLMALNCISVSTSYDQIIDHIVEFHVSQK